MSDIRPIDANAIPYTCGRISKNFIDHMPTLDCTPAAHAHWYSMEEYGITLLVCSNCDYCISPIEAHLYCQNCGARMDERNGEGS